MKVLALVKMNGRYGLITDGRSVLKAKFVNQLKQREGVEL